MRKIEIHLDINKEKCIMEIEDGWDECEIAEAAFDFIFERMMSWDYQEVKEDGSSSE